MNSDRSWRVFCKILAFVLIYLVLSIQIVKEFFDFIVGPCMLVLWLRIFLPFLVSLRTSQPTRAGEGQRERRESGHLQQTPCPAHSPAQGSVPPP